MAVTALAKRAETERMYADAIVMESEGLQIAHSFVTQSYLDVYDSCSIVAPSEETMNPNDMKIRIVKINRIVYDPDELIMDKLISVYSALYNVSATIGLLLQGKHSTTDIYFVIRQDADVESSKDILIGTLNANFPGISYEVMDNVKAREILELNALKGFNGVGCPRDILNRSIASVSLIPSSRDEDKEKFVQGIEKFIDAMSGKDYTALFLATPVAKEILEERKRGFQSLSTTLSPYKKTTLAYGHNDSVAISRNTSKNLSEAVSKGATHTTGTSTSTSHSVNKGSSSGFNFNSHSQSGGSGINFGSNQGTSDSYTEGSSYSHAVTSTTTSTEGVTVGDGETNTKGTSDTITVEIENKLVTDLNERIAAQLQRIEKGFAYGGYDVGCYFYSEDYVTTVSAMSICKGLFTGENSSVEQAHTNLWSAKDKGDIAPYILANISHMQHPLAMLPVATANGHFDTQYAMPTTMLTVNEMPVIFNLPKKSVNGLAVLEKAEFARSIIFERRPKSEEDIISIGRVYHMGQLDGVSPEDQFDISKEWTTGHRVELNLQLFSSHCLICGSSGSGKSWGTYHLLNRFWEKGCKIMIIEPAKGEYKQKFGNKPGMTVYNVTPSIYHMLKINPFCFPKSIHIASHMRKVMDICKAAWSLTAAMPNLLEEAIRISYEQCGWDIDNSIHIDGFSDKIYPTFEDVMRILPGLIDESDYSSENKGNYKGSLLTRVNSMTQGLIGMIFDDEFGIEDKKLFDEDVIVDLSEIGSEDTNAIIMGVLIMRLNEYRQDQRRMKALRGEPTHDESLRHITVLEEAHNLLRRTSTEQNDESSNPAGASVKAISNTIKEIRTYGEGFLIIDQTPSALDDSAIENTATKIVFNTPGKEASETLCSALSLNEYQQKEIANLSTGVAVCYHKDWITPPVLMQIDGSTPAAYERPLELPDRAAIKVVRANLLYLLYQQGLRGKYDEMEYIACIQKSALSAEQKAKFVGIVKKHVNKKMVENVDAVLYEMKNNILTETAIEVAEPYGPFLFALLNCKGLFSMLYHSKQVADEYNKVHGKKNVEYESLYCVFDCLLKKSINQLMVDKKNREFDYLLGLIFLSYQHGLVRTGKEQQLIMQMIDELLKAADKNAQGEKML